MFYNISFDQTSFDQAFSDQAPFDQIPFDESSFDEAFTSLSPAVYQDASGLDDILSVVNSSGP